MFIAQDICQYLERAYTVYIYTSREKAMSSLDIVAYTQAIHTIQKYPKDVHFIDLGRLDRIIPIIAVAYAQDIPSDVIDAALQSATEPTDLESYLMKEAWLH